MEKSKSVEPLISLPSSPEPSENQNYSTHCALAEQEESVGYTRPHQTTSSPDRIHANHNFSGNHYGNETDEGSSSTPTPPPTSPEPTPSPPASPPLGIPASAMRTPSPEAMYHDMIGDLDVMIEIARSMQEVARHTKALLHTAYERVDLGQPRVRNLGMGGVLTDLRQESAHAAVDGQRAQLRYEKVLSDVRRLRRCLRNLGLWHPASRRPQSPQLPADASWGLPQYSYLADL